jgi:hypothetical protein
MSDRPAPYDSPIIAESALVIALRAGDLPG